MKAFQEENAWEKILKKRYSGNESYIIMITGRIKNKGIKRIYLGEKSVIV